MTSNINMSSGCPNKRPFSIWRPLVLELQVCSLGILRSLCRVKAYQIRGREGGNNEFVFWCIMKGTPIGAVFLQRKGLRQYRNLCSQVTCHSCLFFPPFTVNEWFSLWHNVDNTCVISNGAWEEREVHKGKLTRQTAAHPCHMLMLSSSGMVLP